MERRGVGGQLELQRLVDLEDDRSFRMKVINISRDTIVHVEAIDKDILDEKNRSS